MLMLYLEHDSFDLCCRNGGNLRQVMLSFFTFLCAAVLLQLNRLGVCVVP